MTNQAQFAGLECDLKPRLFEEFALALHAMAQPLTVLRGALGGLKLRGASASDADRYVELSNTQVERLCSLMSGMGILLENFRSDAVCAPTNLWELIASIVEEEDSSLQRSGLRISTAEFDRGVQVLADQARAEHALHAAITAVATASSWGDEIYLTVDPRDGFADVMVHAAHAEEKKLTSIDRLRLSVAEVSIRSQDGLFECLADPLRISMKLPLQVHEKQYSEPPDFSLLAAQVQSGRSFSPAIDESMTQV